VAGGGNLEQMAKTYHSPVPEQGLLLPPSLHHWLPENHLAYFVGEVIDQLEQSAIESHYERAERAIRDTIRA
jgi:hypothetical protein